MVHYKNLYMEFFLHFSLRLFERLQVNMICKFTKNWLITLEGVAYHFGPFELHFFMEMSSGQYKLKFIGVSRLQYLFNVFSPLLLVYLNPTFIHIMKYIYKSFIRHPKIKWFISSPEYTQSLLSIELKHSHISLH